jgi:hypothetical protein
VADQSKDVTAAASGPEEHGTRLRNNALNLLGNVGLALGSAAPTASIALGHPQAVGTPCGRAYQAG